MNYILGTILESKITGVEKAQINRLKLFKQQEIPSKCVYIKWNPYLYTYAKQHRIENDVFTMYDYFQKTINYKKTKQVNWLQYWEKACNYTLKFVENSNNVRIYDEEQFIMYAHFLDKQYRDLNYVNYFDHQRRKVKRELFDGRGFLSCSRILGEGQRIVLENYFTTDGTIVIQKYFEDVKGKNTLTKVVVNEGQHQQYFDSEEELAHYFLNQLCKNNDQLILDRPHELGNVMTELRKEIPVIVVLHSTHLTGIEIKSFYKPVFNHLKRYKAIVVSTDKQRRDIAAYIENEIPVVNIPVGHVENPPNNIDFNNKVKGHIISVARLVENKQIKHQIEVIKRLVEKYPDIQLNIYGHGNGLAEYQQLVEKYQLVRHVKFHGFKTQVSEAIAKAQLMLSTSKMEGFGLAILESLSLGTPVISYDVDYGPAELIQDGFNGYLVSEGDIDKMVEKVDQLLNDSQKIEQFSLNSIQSAQQFNTTTVGMKWQNILS
ncbi:serine-aspartate repeat adhesin O-glycosyltransferase SdgA [Staphylococcus argenteus]|uniref:serine-aspartate repeat adhesin O-glycosyltransferase SdgA n=1 Tax=Staphylococcus argenteus TaxID=985002 RepID=UPI000976002F|nr:glycosyltransferase [Staphylococcus argenteus]OMH92718.1 glycosyl transferase family 1 [Staphylococcus argenteus]